MMKVSTVKGTALVVVAVYGDTVKRHSARKVDVVINSIKNSSHSHPVASSHKMHGDYGMGGGGVSAEL